MKYIKIVCLYLAVNLLTACSGFFHSSSSGGSIVTPEYLARYEGGGSLSTLWYLGSDNEYHYFAHFVKISTKYRIKRDQLSWKDEFPRGSRRSSLVRGELYEYVKNNSKKDAAPN